mgnify:CR=1 FL=1
MSKEILQVNQVTARVEDKEILHGVSLDIKKGETHVLMVRVNLPWVMY